MIKVYIWDYLGKGGAWGHASMDVGALYISWWPMGSGRAHSKIHRDIYAAHPIVNRRLEDDIEAEKHPQLNPTGQWNHMIIINGLDEEKIKAWWMRAAPWVAGRLGPPSVPWHTLDWNCSTMVANALKEGGGDAFATWMKSWVLIAWSPNDVREYAESIAQGLRR